MHLMLSYHNVGSIKLKKIMKEDGSGQDLVWGIWVWEGPTVAPAGGKVQMWMEL